MFDDEEVFLYDEANDCVSSLSKYHAENCSIEPLVEAHPDVIYFYATFGPHKEWDFNHVAMPAPDPNAPPLFEIGVDRGSLFIHDHTTPIFTMPAPILFCTGTRFCQGEKHANDCPEWTE